VRPSELEKLFRLLFELMDEELTVLSGRLRVAPSTDPLTEEVRWLLEEVRLCPDEVCVESAVREVVRRVRAARPRSSTS